MLWSEINNALKSEIKDAVFSENSDAGFSENKDAWFWSVIAPIKESESPKSLISVHLNERTAYDWQRPEQLDHVSRNTSTRPAGI